MSALLLIGKDAAMLTILIAPNEDGYGPSSLAYHLVRAFLGCQEEIGKRVAILIRTGTKVDYNRDLYRGLLSDALAPGKVSIEPVHNLIQLTKSQDGRLDLLASFKHLLQYVELEKEYLSRPLPQVDLALDIGVPALAKACAAKNIPCFTVFDHSWGRTFTRLISEHELSGTAKLPRNIRLQDLRRALRAIASGEAATRKVFLCSPPVTPTEYRTYWESVAKVEGIGGCLGVPPDAAASEAWRQSARRVLELRGSSAAVLVSGGGTPVWDETLPRLIRGCVASDRRRKLRYNVLVFASADVRERITGVALEPTARTQKMQRDYAAGRSISARWVEHWRPEGCRRVHVLGKLVNCPYQALLAGTDLVVSRAGGATVNDAIACGVPLLLVPEPGHWQVEAIHQAVIDQGYGLPLPHAEFVNDPVGALDARVQPFKPVWDHIRTQMLRVPRGCENSLVRRMLEEVGLGGK
jgi:hypothetical protein